jgi:hypothetical protein
VISLVVAWQLSLASLTKWQVLVVVGPGAAVLLLFVSVVVWNLRAKDTQERREQLEPEPPMYPRYEPSIRAVTVFFAAVLGFGLKHLLDTDYTQKTADIYTYKWLFFLVAVFIFLRFLTGSANHLWLEYQKSERDDVMFIVNL